MTQTYERVREHGTMETVPGDGEKRLEVIRRIVANGQYEKVDGGMLDLFSAGAICAVYDKLSAENQVKYQTLPAQKMALVAFKLLK